MIVWALCTLVAMVASSLITVLIHAHGQDFRPGWDWALGVGLGTLAFMTANRINEKRGKR